MSATIVLPTGATAKYHAADWIAWNSGINWVAAIYDGNPEENGRFIAKVPRGAVVSFDEPTIVKVAPDASAKSIDASLDILLAAIDSVKDYRGCQKVAQLKSKLQNFDARSMRWK